MANVPELFRTRAPVRPAAIQQQQQQQRQQNAAGGQPVAATDQPPLLARLRECLAAASTSAQHGSSTSTKQQLLHAHHQVFDLFSVACMTTYRPLLLGVKRAYDAALQDAAAAACDNAFLCTRLSHVPANQAHAAVAAARQAAEQQAATMEEELAQKLQQLQHQAQEVQAECGHVEGQLAAMQRSNLLAHREHAQLGAAAARAQAELVEGSSWCGLLRGC